ncbi:MAG: MCP four helix bundle domain-containing protein, partial [Burkholderiaceae bacterium]|nr:MCP four helix bundle domain-containing protein [Burkholderiaceae bacterium]
MNLETMKVSTRLGVGFGLVLLMMAILIGLALVRFASVGEINNKIIEKDWVKADAANTINLATRANARGTMELLIMTDKAHVAQIYERIEANKKTIDAAVETLVTLIYTPEGKDLLAKTKEARAKYAASFTKVVKLIEEGRRDEAISLMNAETLPALDALQVHIAGLTELQKTIVVADSAQVRQDIDSARVLMTMLGGAALFIGIGAAFLITRTLLKQLGGEPGYAAGIAGSIAAGDLSVPIEIGKNDRTSLLVAMKAMRDSLANIVGQVRVGTDTIATASSQIASGNLDLSSRTEQQASSLEETASSMEELTSTVKQNADNARQANQLAVSASDVALKGGAVVEQVVETMGSINDSAKKIVDIIGVIDGIAFQTNILALNAAVEAARAGEQGRGFAVVATEVRNLAQRSAAAAKEIKTLIGDSVGKVEVGSRLVDQAGSTMREIVDSVRRVTDIMGEITCASQEQTAGIEQINEAITQMDDVTQQNAALVEEAAAAANALQDQADNLARVVSVFTLDGVRAAAAAPASWAAASRWSPPKCATWRNVRP